jgi:gliding motility-associated-like protein
MLSTLTISDALAQNGLYDVRILIKTFDCANNTVIFQVQVRASKQTNKFMLGDANYRFTYDPRQIKHPTLASQDNFSNQSPAMDRNYGPQNLTGSTEGSTKAILSINCFYSGSSSGAMQVDTSWTNVSSIKFDVLDDSKCINIKWNNNNTFPITGMNEVIVKSVSPYDYTTANVRSNSVFLNVEGCFPNACDNKAPSVVRAPIIVDEDSLITTCMRIIDDNFSDKHTVSVCQNPINGILLPSVNTNSRELCMTYKPNANYAGIDSICVLVCDNGSPIQCDTVKMTITVNQKPDTPSVLLLPLIVQSGIQLDTCFTIQDNDMNDTFSATLCGTSKGVSNITVSGNQLCLSYKSPDFFSGADSLCITVCDSYGVCKTIKTSINVMPCNDTIAPVIICPANVEVSLGGNTISDNDKFITNGTISDNCNTVILNFRNLIATDDCGVKSITQVSGIHTGGEFGLGLNTLIFEAKDYSGKITTCKIDVTVQPVKLLSVNTLNHCFDDVLYVSTPSYPNASYLWTGPRFNINSNTLTFPIVSISQKGLYTINATLGKNCTYRDSFNLTLKEAPILEDDAYIMPINATLRDTVTINDSLTQNLTYTVRLKDSATNGILNFENNGSFTYRPINGFAGVVGFTYELCYDNCPSACRTAAVSIKVADEKRSVDRGSNIITPNGDGVNDALVIEGFDPTQPDNNSQMTIFSQWGEKVYSASPYNNDWRGTFSGQALPIGTYYFIFKRHPDAIAITSFVSIVR